MHFTSFLNCGYFFAVFLKNCNENVSKIGSVSKTKNKLNYKNIIKTLKFIFFVKQMVSKI